MDKQKLKKFATTARLTLRQSVTNRLGYYGISRDTIHRVAQQGDAYLLQDLLGQERIVTPWEGQQQDILASAIENKGFDTVVEEVAYTIFNRLIAIRYMEVNDYLPTRDRVLSGADGSVEPEIVTNAPDIGLDLNDAERERVYDDKENNRLDDLFRFLFFKQCEELSTILPGLFTPTEGYVELLFDLSYLDADGVIRQLIDLGEEDFRDQVAIIGWMYQYYNAELKDETFALLKKNVKITKDRIPSATQLFTPDWIVRYMVENSLGRLWLDGHGKDPSFDWKYYLDEASQDNTVQTQLDALRQDAAQLRPEDITVIDPCMGSGHILVYAFDVLMDIYRSAGYRDRDAVKSILAHNLYGLDIDERAWQLAYFAVMMKARQYYPRIFRHAVPCHLYYFTDSKDIDKDTLTYFGGTMDELTKNVVLPQLEGLIDVFADAREYGSLLKVEPYDWQLLHEYVDHMDETKGGDLFVGNLTEIQQKLQHLVNVAEVLSRKYDVVVTNPPYMGSGNMNKKLSDFVKKCYKNSKSDLFACFMEAGNRMVVENGYNCMVTMQSWMFLSSFEQLRTEILETKTITNLMHMENMVMGIAFGTAVTVLKNTFLPGYKGTYIQIKYEDIQNEVPYTFPVMKNRFAQVSSENFTKIPGSPIAYWLSENLRKIFTKGRMLKECNPPRAGLSTADNERFLRMWWEVEITKSFFSITSSEDLQNESQRCKWFPMTKGGEFRRWYGNNTYILNFEKDGQELKYWLVHNPKDPTTTSYSRYIRNYGFYGKEGFSFSDVTSGKISFRYQPHGFIPNARGPFIYSVELSLLAYLNSKVISRLLVVIAPTMTFNVGDIAKTPYIPIKNKLVNELVQQNISLAKADWDAAETSWDFQRHPLFPSVGDDFNRPTMSMTTSLAEAYEKVKASVNARFDQLKANEEELNRIFIDIYGLGDELTPDVADKDVTVARIYDDADQIPDSMKGNAYVQTKEDVAKSFISYAVGCMFGRYSLDMPGLAYAGGDWDDSKYKQFIPDKDNVLPITDAEYFDDDMVTKLYDFVRTIYGEELMEQNMQWLANALGGRGTARAVIRSYFLNGFYKDHVKRYKKRPIYWLFDSGKKNGFKALIYMHRYTPDLVGRVRTAYLHILQRKLQEQVDRIDQTLLSATLKPADKARLTKEKKHLQDQLAEMQPYEEAVAHMAYKRIALDLDDGVKVNYEKFQHVTITRDDGTTKTIPLLGKI